MELLNLLYKNLALQIMQFCPNAGSFLSLKAIHHAAGEAAVEGKALFEAVAHAASKAFTEEAIGETVAKVFPKDVPEALQKTLAEIPKEAKPAETIAEVAAAAPE